MSPYTTVGNPPEPETFLRGDVVKNIACNVGLVDDDTPLSAASGMAAGRFHWTIISELPVLAREMSQAAACYSHSYRQSNGNFHRP